MVVSLGGAPRNACSLEPDLLPEPLWWRAAEAVPLERDPVAALAGGAGLALAAEWAPLLAAGSGSRLERATRTARFAGAAGRLTAGLEWSERVSIMRGGERDWGVGAGFARERHAAIGARLVSSRLATGMALVATTERLGAAGGLTLSLSPAWRAELGASDVPAGGRTDVRWFDVAVVASGQWRERRSFARVRGEWEHSGAWFALASRDDAPGGAGASGDLLHPRLAWRTAGAGAAWRSRGSQWSASIEHGMGREGFRLRRSGTSYAVAVAGVSSSLIRVGALRGDWQARAWGGRYGAEWAGDLALWPFDPLAAIAGTRRLARSSLALLHSGLSLDRRARGRGLDGGVALWHLEPRARWESWQATFVGLGHEDESAGLERLERAWLAGARVALQLPAGGSNVRIELVQWVPFGVRRATVAADGAPGAGALARSGSDRGGTVVRLSLASD